ncbi:uncharacterized protein LOC134277280 [Saccostrea cucullata]|uniref:uncharacterized protein LOC134277280 n=1 Tax=Saccostrea cuccullata TaxID=36930 RepID=UPI002ED5B9A8
MAHCFVSDFWPPSVQSSWVDRCHSWPPPHVVQDIIQNGCHLVAIGHKKGKLKEVRWRISFSCAEEKLVHSVNHCQFLTYRLLKLFLKDVVNSGVDDDDKLLSSYHMKTLMFWIIQQNTIPVWCPQNLLQCFWTCFELLLKWVSKRICPNFFIPENNLFLSNIHEEAQRNLLDRLNSIRNRGLVSLFYSPFMGHILTGLNDQTIFICTEEQALISEDEYDLELFKQASFYDCTINCINLYYRMKYLNLIEQLITYPQTQPRFAVLQKLTVIILRKNAFEISFNTSGNKKLYIVDRMSCHMLKLAAKFGCISDMLYIAIYYYRTLRYQDALKVINTTKVKLAKPYVMYHTTRNEERYCDAVGGQSWSTKLRQALAWHIRLDLKICYMNMMNELIPELQCCFIFGNHLFCYTCQSSYAIDKRIQRKHKKHWMISGSYFTMIMTCIYTALSTTYHGRSWEFVNRLQGSLELLLFLPTILQAISDSRFKKCFIDENTQYRWTNI